MLRVNQLLSGKCKLIKSNSETCVLNCQAQRPFVSNYEDLHDISQVSHLQMKNIHQGMKRPRKKTAGCINEEGQEMWLLIISYKAESAL